MISDELHRQIERTMWPDGDLTPGSLWAILDCARDTQVYPELQTSRLGYECLYSGELPTALKHVAPHIVELGPRYRFTRRLFDLCWGRNWCIFARLNDGTRLRGHLRKLLTVKTEDGRKLLFRFYDPRVLRTYLPTCNAEELRAVFGPISIFYAESLDAMSTLRAYSFDGRDLCQVPDNAPIGRGN
ncbi:DUF4123 domain-containing protein [Piscinibacter sakaiensis]|uniref:DUF4123 domain-containing protein n=1 Tax=Piscinibacter sakaiensis TaxID=1547922 RepID=UPI003AAF8A1A